MSAAASPDAQAGTVERKNALVTGVGRSIGIGSAIARGLVDDGWTVVTAGHRAYDGKMSWGADPESFDLHFAVNARATWLLIKAFAEQFPSSTEPRPSGRIVAITSDHAAFNLPYGASKGALDRIVIAAATELADLGITANVINPGGTDTGWMTPEIVDDCLRRNLQPRIGLPEDCANLVRFLCSPQGAWINAQLLYSDGGLTPR